MGLGVPDFRVLGSGDMCMIWPRIPGWVSDELGVGKALIRNATNLEAVLVVSNQTSPHELKIQNLHRGTLNNHQTPITT